MSGSKRQLPQDPSKASAKQAKIAPPAEEQVAVVERSRKKDPPGLQFDPGPFSQPLGPAADGTSSPGVLMFNPGPVAAQHVCLPPVAAVTTDASGPKPSFGFKQAVPSASQDAASKIACGYMPVPKHKAETTSTEGGTEPLVFAGTAPPATHVSRLHSTPPSRDRSPE